MLDRQVADLAMGEPRVATPPSRATVTRRRVNVLVALRKHWLLYALFAPTLILIVVFNFIPNILTVPLVFKKYYLLKGIWGSPWIGLGNLEALWKSPDFLIVLRNTIIISVYRLVFGFFPPIILAILTHDLLLKRVRRITQSITYLPHFFSWPIVYGIVLALINPANGVIITFLRGWGLDPGNLLVSEAFFRPLIVITGIWKEVGWGAIIYLAALAGIEPELYEAATVDGAEWYHRIIYITLPGIKPVVTLLLTLSLAGILSAGFEQVYLFYSPLTYSVGDIIDTWVYRRGLLSADFGLATAVGFFKSVVGLLLILTANKLAKRFAGQGIW